MDKASKLNYMANNGVNVAQFISVKREEINKPKYVHIYNNSESITDTKSEILKLINTSGSKSVNIRSFSEEITKGSRFVMGKGVNDIEEILQVIKENAENGLDSIINENIDVCDGGVSGVVIGDIIEFSPNDTPRCVEKDGVCSLPRDIGISILEAVYGFKPNLEFDKKYRVEFSIHPLKQGIKQQHTIIWEYEEMEQNSQAKIVFPNNFSRHIGDKVFGLLLSDRLGFNVPYSTIISRTVAPFSFGKNTGSNEIWLRTAPIVKEAGKYTTCKGWIDPFELLSDEDSNHKHIGSVISQHSVNSLYSGASIVNGESFVIEGIHGNGDVFMIGDSETELLPESVSEKIKEVCNLFKNKENLIGNISFEWVYDGKDVWVVQLNQLKNASSIPNTVVDGHVEKYIKFETNLGLEKLRELISTIDTSRVGIELLGNVGITSHFGDILRQNKVTSYISRR